MKTTTLLFLILLTGATTALSQTTVTGNVSGLWAKENSPYIIVGNATIPNGEELVIEAGVTVRWKPTGDASSLIVRGTLTVAGGAGAMDEVFFTSNALRPRGTDWGTVVVRDGATAKISYAKFDYHQPAINTVGGALVEVRNSTFTRYDLTKHNVADPDTTVYAIGGFIPDTMRIVGCTFDGIGKTRDGMSLQTNNRGILLVDSCRITNFAGNGIYALYDGNGVDPAKRKVIVSNSVINHANTGLLINGGMLSEYRIEGNRITDCGDGLQLTSITMSNPVILKNDIYDIRQTGSYIQISAPMTDSVLFRNNRIHHSAIGAYFKHATWDTIKTTFVVFNTIAYCDRPLEVQFMPIDTVWLQNNIFAECRSRMLAAARFKVGYNLFWNHNEYDQQFLKDFVTDSDLYGDPSFVGEYDLHVQDNSITIDRADPTEDVGDEPVANGMRANIGGYGTTSEATITTGIPLGAISTIVPRDVTFSLSALNLQGTNRQIQKVQIGNYGDDSMSIVSFTLRDSVNFSFRNFKPIKLAPLERTAVCTLFFQPQEAKQFNEKLIVQTSAGIRVLPITGQSTGQPIITGYFPHGTTMLKKDKSPYIFSGSVSNRENDTLIIEPGVTILMKDLTSSLFCQGTLIAEGTREDPVFVNTMASYHGTGDRGGFLCSGPTTIRYMRISNIGSFTLNDTPHEEDFEMNVENLIKEGYYVIYHSNITFIHRPGGQIFARDISTRYSSSGLHVGIYTDVEGISISNITAIKNNIGVDIMISAGEDMILPPQRLLENSIIASNDIGIQVQYSFV